MTKAARASLDAAAQRRAFHVAGVAQADLIAGVQTALADALKNGTTLEEFMQDELAEAGIEVPE